MTVKTSYQKKPVFQRLPNIKFKIFYMFPLDNAFTKGSLQKKKTTQKHMESIDSSC